MRSYGYRKNLQQFSPRNTCTFTVHTKSRLISSWIFPLLQADFKQLGHLSSGKRFRQNSHHLHCYLQIFGGFYFAVRTSTKWWFDILSPTFLLRYLRSIENILLTSLTPLEEPNRSTAKERKCKLKERKCKLKQRVFSDQVSYETKSFASILIIIPNLCFLKTGFDILTSSCEAAGDTVGAVCSTLKWSACDLWREIFDKTPRWLRPDRWDRCDLPDRESLVSLDDLCDLREFVSFVSWDIFLCAAGLAGCVYDEYWDEQLVQFDDILWKSRFRRCRLQDEQYSLPDMDGVLGWISILGTCEVATLACVS